MSALPLTMPTAGLPVFRLSNTGAWSAKFGPCECCGKAADTTYYLTEARTFVYDGEHHITHHKCGSWFGHRECLAAVTERGAS